MHFILPQHLHAALMNYLGTRPINEALPLFAALQRLQGVDESANTEKASVTDAPSAPPA
jgi:hypothetical protein